MRKILTWCAIPLVLIILWWLGWGRAPGARQVSAVLDSFPAPSTWILVESSVQGRSPFCGDNPCPGGSRQWGLPSTPTAGELQGLMGQAGWPSAGFDGDCRAKPNRTGPIPLCTARTSAHGLHIALSVVGPSGPPDRQFTVVLLVSE
ncbi:hypothetical protein GCM10027610_124640 [Dactylosporangium cerinum]